MGARIQTFEEFFPYYLGQHALPATRALHYIGTTLFMASLVALAATLQWPYLLFALVVGYIFANLDKDIGLPRLTEVSGVSARTLQNAFARHFGKGPITFVKQAKLYRVREDLQSFTPADTTVTKVAMDWGFYHASNFSRNYSDLFGELPIQTLRNRR